VSAEQDFKTFANLQQTRSNFDWYWQRISDYVIPRRADFTVQRFQGQRRDYNVYDTTAEWALEQLSAGMHTLLTSQALPWFYLRVRNPALNDRPEVRAWLDDTWERINAVFNDPHSKFQSQIHEYYTDLGAFGTAVMWAEYDKGVKFSTRYLGECWIRQTHYGYVDTCYRQFNLTKSQAIELFGAKLPTKLLEEKDEFKEHPFLHVVEPNGSKWDSRYYWIQDKALVKESTYQSFPYIVARWSKSVIEDYGRSPAMRCFSDILMVNEMKRTMLRAQQKAVDPPLLIPDDGFVQQININPGQTSYVDPTSPGEIRYLESKGRFDVGEAAIKEVQQAITRSFYVDMLQLPGGLMPGAQNQNTYMTATEATIRRENAMRVLGPIVSRLQNELLNPLIVRVFSILKEQRSLAPAPASIQNESIDIEYVSPLAIAQEGAEVDNWTRMMAQIQPVAALDPTVLDGLNLPALPNWLAKKYHVPQELLNTPQQIEQIQKQRQQQQQAEQNQIQENTNLMSAKRNSEAVKSMTQLAGANAAQ
jgi:hypothetical protein